MAIIYMLISGFLAASSNFCMRRSMDFKGSCRAFYIFQLGFTCVVTLFLYPMRAESLEINYPIIFLGVLTGVFLGFMKLMINKALQKGPPGLTFAAVNSASVMPAGSSRRNKRRPTRQKETAATFDHGYQTVPTGFSAAVLTRTRSCVQIYQQHRAKICFPIHAAETTGRPIPRDPSRDGNCKRFGGRLIEGFTNYRGPISAESQLKS